MDNHQQLQPPGPFADFDFTFDPSMSNLPPLPPSADLFSPDETMNILGFLDNLASLDWELAAAQEPPYNDFTTSPSLIAPYSNPHLNTTPEPSALSHPSSIKRARSTRGTLQNGPKGHTVPLPDEVHIVVDPQKQTTEPPTPTSPKGSDRTLSTTAHRSRPLLSTPQKRLNHIMSEQKRRNAIRDGYAQLIALLAPAGSANTIGMPTRGRPRGSGSRGNSGQTKGKSGVLFRAVEYCQWLEEGRDALREEVLRLEAAAGIRHS